jgi:hypothetical protein
MDMNNWKRIPAMLAFAACVLAVTDAAAWGPRAQSVAAKTALRVVRRSYPDALKTKDRDYEAELLEGTAKGIELFSDTVGLRDSAAVDNVIGAEIQLLREARRYGAGSYFAFRMGALSALVSEAMLPFALDAPPEAQALIKQINADVDKHVHSYTFKPERAELVNKLGLVYIRNPQAYFGIQRERYPEVKELIEADYAQGVGYDGYLRNGAEAIFVRTVMAVADVWNTVLRQEGDPSDVPPSDTAMTWYLVDEIGYQLLVKRNDVEAEKAYSNFVNVNPDLLRAYEAVGDYFFKFGNKERGVREWQAALTFAGPEHERVLEKLAQYYIGEGQALVQEADTERGSETALDDAVRQFKTALEYDRDNAPAVEYIRDTQIKIQARNALREKFMTTIANAESVAKKAQTAEESGVYADALAQYESAMDVYAQVGQGFRALTASAADGTEECLDGINRINEALLDSAQNRIDNGERRVNEFAFEEAEKEYQSVEKDLALVSEESKFAQQKAELIQLAKDKIAEIPAAKKRHEEDLKREAARKKLEAERRQTAPSRSTTRSRKGLDDE